MKKLMLNLPIKLLSLSVALVTWMFITSINNPVTNGFINVPVTVENEEYILNQNKTYSFVDSRVVRVNYIVKQSEQTHIRQNDFKVYVDLTEVDNKNEVPVHAVPMTNIETYVSNIEVEPKKLSVEYDDVFRSQFTVQYNLVGELGDGHTIGNIILSPSVVYISSGSSALESVDRVAVEIPIAKKEENFSGVAKVKLYRKDGSLIANDGYVFSAEDINYSVVVNSWATAVVNEPIIEGNVKSGYVYGGVEIKPNSIVINGPRSVIQNMYTVDLPAINIDGLDASKEYVFETSEILPVGITSNELTIKVKITVNSNVLNRSGSNLSEVGPHIESSNEETSDSNSEVIQQVDDKVDNDGMIESETQSSVE